MTLTEFLLARIAEDEEMARNALALGGDYYDDKPVKWHWISTNGESASWQPSPVNPARVLAECEAKRRIVNAHRSGFPDEDRYATGWHDMHIWAQYQMARPYADHPDYDPEWAA